MPKELPVAALVRLIKSVDPNIRVSEDAAKVLGDKLESESFQISRRAKEFALHAKRKTITAEDILLATKVQ
ncbi:MAG: NFYB/HAP3 family transcription factor subunit [Candidatus Diapherotrites archaeon]|nr:NFYB/HAP3 family transcription factor subunit [Candidatus Diapherotrites archaeon]